MRNKKRLLVIDPELGVGGGGASPDPAHVVSVENQLTGHITDLDAMTLTYIKTYRIADRTYGSANMCIKGAIYKQTNGQFEKVAETEEHCVTDDWEGWITLNFPSPVSIDAGTYFVGIGGSYHTNARSFITYVMTGCVRKRKDISYPTFPATITSWLSPDWDECLNIVLGYEVPAVKRILGDGLTWIVS